MMAISRRLLQAFNIAFTSALSNAGRISLGNFGILTRCMGLFGSNSSFTQKLKNEFNR